MLGVSRRGNQWNGELTHDFSQPQFWGSREFWRRKAQFLVEGSCLLYYAYRRMIAVKMVLVRFGGK